jgi:hypothetical protein
MTPIDGADMSITTTALTHTAESEAQGAIELAEVEAYCDRIATIIARIGGPGVNRVHSTGRQWLTAIAEHQQGQLRLGAEVQRKAARTSVASRTDRLLTAVANADGTTR